ncbi:PTS transporter subunit EIIC [Cronobacter sakazakii]|uniref:PTS sugar transporter subunit IIC n=1 Tax=Cronobacter sakazakii TaxID=28141 RepID=UPI000CFB7EB0|nr:PTS transporter subunit EIIC [Cronobacter sakazakii]EKK3975451.1 PTS sugar transporter subunit IIC [Cronobacter sakazakii]EKY1981134.1 PTS sugar transporter subunit IIC [Cronobacter sakazakii]EKY1998716.1 PTS sugar transporter subunit IIC [Cronobacter sakazakii]ELY4543832.1 PTS sugar transporter subunit IIC [Cronobacter sakazakii]ELY4590074.1 PTS sugar transporter subunit IIC [Cronobacter sakazakii]
MSLYTGVMALVERHVAPLAGRIGTQRHIIAIRDGFICAMPFLIIGSIMLIIANPPFDEATTSAFGRLWLGFAKAHWNTITMPFFMTMGLMSVFVSVGTAYSLAKSYQLDGLTAGLLSLTAFLLVAAPQADNKLSLDFLGGQGVFTALLCAVWSVELTRLLKKYGITLRLPEQVPPAIARSFDLLLPMTGILLTLYPLSLVMQSEFQMLIPAAVMQLFQPVIAAGDSLPAILLCVLLANLLWFAGIHGDNLVQGLLNPLFMANIAANAALLSQGAQTTQVLTAPFWAFYVCIGGSGSTLVLALLYLRSRSAHLKTIGRLSIVPAVFNINEPLLFGSPVVMNPTLFVPLLLVPLVNTVLAYVALEMDLVQKMVAMAPWTAPAPLGAMISAAWDMRAALLVVVLLVVDGLLWYPFFKVYEKQLISQERAQAQESDAATASAQTTGRTS